MECLCLSHSQLDFHFIRMFIGHFDALDVESPVYLSLFPFPGPFVACPLFFLLHRVTYKQTNKNTQRDVDFPCGIDALTIIFVAIARMALYVFFLIRLKISFDSTVWEISIPRLRCYGQSFLSFSLPPLSLRPQKEKLECFRMFGMFYFFG